MARRVKSLLGGPQRRRGGGDGGGRPVESLLGGGGGRAAPREPQGTALGRVGSSRPSGGVLNRLAGEASGIVRGFPGATVQLAKDFGTDVSSFVKDAPGDVVAGFTDPFGPKPSERRGYSEAEQAERSPLSFGLVESGKRTVHRVTHPSEYAKAYEEGHLLGALLEDVGNITLVASATTGGLKAAAGKGFAEAESSRVAAGTLRSRAIPAAEKAVKNAEQKVATSQAARQTIQQALDKGADPVQSAVKFRQIDNQLADEMDELTRAQGTLQETHAKIAEHESAAEAGLANVNPAILRAYRVSEAIRTLGAKGANAPAAPFGIGLKAAGKTVSKLLDLSPGLKAQLGEYARAASLRFLNTRMARAVLDAGQADELAIMHQFNDIVAKMDRELGSEDLWHVAMLDLTGSNRSLADAISVLEQTAGREAADEAIARLAAMPEMEATPEALQMSLDLARGRLDPETTAKIRRAQQRYVDGIDAVLKRRKLEGKGTPHKLTEPELEQSRWQVEGMEPNPAARAALEGRQAQRRAEYEGAVDEATEAAQKAQEAIALPAEVLADLPGAMARNAELALGAAQDLYQRALSDERLMAELLGLARLRDNATPEQIIERIAGLISRAAVDGPVARRAPLLRQAAINANMAPLAAPSGNPLGAVERVGEARGRLSEAVRTKQRIASVHARRVGASKRSVDRIVRAVENLRKAKVRVEEKLAKAAEARRSIAEAHQLPDAENLPDHMVSTREYVARQTEGSLTAADDHVRLVADAAEAGEAIPKWVYDELYAEAKAAGKRATADQKRIIANKNKATRAWNKSKSAEVYNELVDEARSVRQAVVDQADAELVAMTDLPLPDRLDYLPGGMSEFYDDLVGRLGGPEWNIGEAMRAYRNENPTSKLTDQQVFANLYASHWRKMPKVAQEAFSRLSDQDVAALYGRWRRGQVHADMGGLDEWSSQWENMRPDLDREGATAAMLDAMERRAALRRMVKSGPKDGFYPEDLQRFYAAVEDADVLGFRDDPAMRIILERGRSATTLDRAARELWESRLQQARTGVELPDPRRLQALYDDTDISLEDVLYRAYAEHGNQALADEALQRWYDAGQPDLEPAIEQMLAGEAPTWLGGETATQGAAAVARAERRALAANRLDQGNEAFLGREVPLSEAPGRSKLTPEERVLAEAQVAPTLIRNPERVLERVIGEEGGTAVTGKLAEQAEARVGTLEGAQGAAGEAAAKGIGEVLRGPVGRQQRQVAVQVQDYMKAVRTLKMRQRRLERLDVGPDGGPGRDATELAKFAEAIKNAPARERPRLLVVKNAMSIFDEMYDEFSTAVEQGRMAPEVLDALTNAQAEVARYATLEQVLGTEYVAGPGGEVTALPTREPAVYVPGGRVPAHRGTGAKGSVRMRDQQGKRTAVIPRNARELQKVLSQKVHREIINDVARQFEGRFGARPEMILGEERVAQLAEEWETNPRPVRQAILDEMEAQGYVPWDPRKLYPETQAPRGLGTTQLSDPLELTTTTMFLPKEMVKQFDDYFRGPGSIERAMRRYYDRPTNVWKGSVLALSPRWHVNNIIGNFIMSTLGGGVDPVTWAASMRDAYAVIKRDALDYAAQHPEMQPGRLGRAVNKALGGTERRLARAEARVGQIDPGVLESLADESGGLSIDPRIPQRGAGAASLDPYTHEIVSNPSLVRRAVQQSYHFNGFVDDLNRVALYMAKYRQMSAKEVAEFVARHPELAQLRGGPEQMRREAAVRMSLDALGNFTKMKPWERNIARRAFPFYAWLRHITKLAARLPITNPARVVWMLHVGDMYGEPPEFSFLSSAIPLGGDQFLRLPRGNPFEDTLVVPKSGDPAEVIGALAGSAGPIPRIGTAALTGIDTRTLTQFNRPAATDRPGEYQRGAFTPLIGRPEELFSFLLDQTPQGRVVRAGYDQATTGEVPLRYPTGQAMRTSEGATIDSGRSFLSELAGLSGAPYPTTVDTESLRTAVEERRLAREATRTRQQRRPAPSGGRQPSSLFR